MSAKQPLDLSNSDNEEEPQKKRCKSLIPSALMECTVCYDEFDGPIYQCMNGHLVCCNCHPRCDMCPTCRSDTAFTRGIRNKALEAII